MTIVTSMRSLLTLVAGGTALAAFVMFAAAAILVLFLIPGGLGILTLEWDRLQRGWRRALACLVRAKPKPRPESL